jgi:hypothetical protein
MMRPTLLAAVVAPALLAGTGTAFAQDVIVEAPPTAYVVPSVPAPPASYYYEYYAPPPPPSRVIRYYYRYNADPDEEVVVVRPRTRGCGPNAYWNGQGCVYARW